ncbi:FtsX-like permease family protein [Permianibacter sp. IMCC34836]|uniref:ABC transporter permease n=1 Tax=Permianibacter fluminis TaxID=2738515 RepID=UPI0015573171|nr:FtsX-like permease family protein [Permianibacter fluminis]NQD36954.1 FtsX-like permease family protein [Permianibacter fluminis]
MFLFLLKSAFLNAWRHRLRAVLTVTGLVVAILAFGLLKTIVTAWYAGADAASNARLVTRSSISLVFTLPISYKDRIRRVDGVTAISWANWFGGIYIDERNFFPQFAISNGYLDQYPEFVVAEADKKAFLVDRRGVVAGRKLAKRFGWQVGDVIPLKGTIFPGEWSFVLRAIYDGREQNTDENQFFFHWDYLNETMKKSAPRRANRTGVFIVSVNNPDNVAEISAAIDKEFRNSLAETLTETEKAFQLGFVSMTEAIVVAIEIVSYVVILIIMAVMANTMAMAARERTSEYATLKALGFSPGFISMLIVLESVLLCAVGAVIGIALTYPLARGFGNALDNVFPVFNVARETPWLQSGCALVVALVAAATPAIRSARIRIVDGLRSIG